MIRYVVDLQNRTCFPEDLDTSDLVDVTTLTDDWRVFISRLRPEVVKCADYFKQLQEQNDGHRIPS